LGFYPRAFAARLNPNGRVDDGFNPQLDGQVLAWAVQPDGKIVIGGVFSTVAGQTRNHLARLNADGTLDNEFNPGVASGREIVWTLALQADGKILVGGDFRRLGRQTRNFLGRLNPDGSVDQQFNPGASDRVGYLTIDKEGRILAIGDFTTFAGVPRSGV